MLSSNGKLGVWTGLKVLTLLANLESIWWLFLLMHSDGLGIPAAISNDVCFGRRGILCLSM